MAKTTQKKSTTTKASKAKKLVAPKRSSKKKAKSSKVNKRSALWGFVKRFFIRTTAVLMLCLLAITLYLDLLVTSKFEGQKWALPAHVYTRAMDIYVGQSIPSKTIVAELEELGYQPQQKNSHITRAGQFFATTESIDVFQRAFKFWDSQRDARKIRITWRNGFISRIVSDAGQLDAVRIEPRLFGSVSPLNHEDRSLITLEETPQALIDALLVMEDRKFYRHWGVDPLGIARAMVRNIKAGRTVQGGSTLTQQLIKNYFLSSERTIQRKLTEMVMAFLLEFHYSKDEILQAYLNEVNLGQSGNRAIHGFGLGSEFLFGRPIGELELHQQATLAGMVKGPSSYNPVRNPKRAKKRRNLVLEVMAQQGLIQQSVADAQKLQPLMTVGSRKSQASRSYPAFTDFIREQLLERYQSNDLNEVGLSIYTTLDPRAQSRLDQAINKTLNQLNKAKPKQAGKIQVAAISVRTDNGEVLAISGGSDVVTGGFNRALNAKRPIGSLVKPFILLSALQQAPEKYQLNNFILDDQVTISQKGSDDWTPNNYDNAFHGDVMLLDALAKSYNVPFVKIGMDVGLESVVETLYSYGLEKKPRKLPSILLGSIELSPLEVSQLYLTLASGGFHTPLSGVNFVLDNEDKPLETFELKIKQASQGQANNLVTYGLQEVMRSGTAASINRSFSAGLGLAGKTGTTNDFKDSWFAGFSGDVLTVVWVGRDDNRSVGLTGGKGAGQVWKNYMSNMPLLPLEPLVAADVELLESPTLNDYEGDLLQYDCTFSRSIPVTLVNEGSVVCSEQGFEDWSSDSPFGRGSKRRATNRVQRFLDSLFN